MNKYAATGMLFDALNGKRFIVVERSHHDVRDALHVFAEAVEALGLEGVKVYRANGAEMVKLPSGGRVWFATPRGYRLRGMSADVVFIDNDAHRVLGDSFDAHDRWKLDVELALHSLRGKVVHS